MKTKLSIYALAALTLVEFAETSILGSLAEITICLGANEVVRGHKEGIACRRLRLSSVDHNGEFGPVDKQPVVRPNRDTLFSTGLFDLDAGPVTVILPNAGKHFMSMQVMDEDMYTPQVIYDAGSYTFTREQIDTGARRLSAVATSRCHSG